MKRSMLVLALFGVLVSRQVLADICAGAEGASTACAPACSNIVVNSNNYENSGTFNVGGGNQGNGNDGFQNVGNFNIGSGNKGNCNINSGGVAGSCDPSNNAGRMVLRYCNVYPTDPMCNPVGYLSEFSDALKSQIAGVVASCNGGTPVTPLPTTVPAVTPSVPPTVTPPAPITPALPPKAPAPSVPIPTLPPVLPPTTNNYKPQSDSQANLVELLELFAQHIAQEKALGRKMKL